MRIVPVPCLQDNYAYLLIDDQKRAVVVDPSEAEPIEAALREQDATLHEIWLTHHHWDHVGGIEGLCDARSAVAVLGSTYDQEHGRIPRQTRALSEGDTLEFAGKTASILEIPGHTLGAIAFVFDDCMFTGDTLFIAGCGRVFEGTMPMMQQSLAKLRKLPGALRIYCGHEYTLANLRFAASVEPDNTEVARRITWASALRERGEPTIGAALDEELSTNPFLRWDAPAVIAAAQERGAGADPGAIFGAIRTAKDNA